MKSKEELEVIKNFLKREIEQAKKERTSLLKDVCIVFPESVAVKIIKMVSMGEDPVPVAKDYYLKTQGFMKKAESYFGKVRILE